MNPDPYNKIMRNVQKRDLSPNDKHQFGKIRIDLDSIYRNSFHGPEILEAVKYKKRLIR